MTTKIKTFKPFLAPNEQPNLDDIKYCIFASMKLDGIRCLFIKGEMLSRSLKPIQNKQLREKLQPLADYTKEHGLILDGEIYSPELTFQEIVKFVMTQDFEDKKSIKKHNKVLTIPEHLKFYCFDCIDEGMLMDCYFTARLEVAKKIIKNFQNIAILVKHKTVNSKLMISEYFDEVLKEGYEGLILRDPKGKYKFGRCTLNEHNSFKVKPFETFDATIISVIQATKVDPNAEKKINELNRSVTSKKIGDRILINRASAFEVMYEGKSLKVVIAMTDEEKEEIWAKRSTYIGKTIEYKGMLIGSKDVPRHPVMIRFREDK